MRKWVYAGLVIVLTLVIGGTVGLLWHRALHSDDLATILAFVSGLLVGVIGANAAMLVYRWQEDKEMEREVRRPRD